MEARTLQNRRASVCSVCVWGGGGVEVRFPGSSSPFTSQVDVAAETEAFASPTPKPCNTAWVAREPERLEAKAWREKTWHEVVGARGLLCDIPAVTGAVRDFENC